MHRFSVIAMAAFSVGACGQAGATAPDHNNPAHCIAAYNYGAFWLSQDASSQPKVAAEIAKGIYEMNKIKASGASVDAAQLESERLSKAYAKDSTAMDALYQDCTEALRADAEFRRQFQTLLQQAKSVAANYRPKL